MEVLKIPKTKRVYRQVEPKVHTPVSEQPSLNVSQINDTKSVSDLSFVSADANHTSNKAYVFKNDAVSFLNDMRYLMNNLNDSYKDLSIILNNERQFQVHSILFAIRSVWYRELIEKRDASKGFIRHGDTQYKYERNGTNDHELHLNGIKSDSFIEFISYLYTTSFKASDKNELDLLRLSKLFKINKLNYDIQSLILNKLSKFDLFRLFEVLKCSHLINDAKLKQECIVILVMKILQDKDILNIQIWKDLCNQHADLVSEIFEQLN